MIIYGYAISDAGDSSFVRMELGGTPERPTARLAPFGVRPLLFDSVRLAADTSTIRWVWPGRTHAHCSLERLAEYHWEGGCRSSSGARRVQLGGGYTPDLGQDLPVTTTDVRILDRALALLASPAVWNRADERICDDDVEVRRFSLFCALYRASIEVTGEYLHRRPAMRAPRELIIEQAADRVTAHTLRDFNNHPETSLGDVRRVLIRARERLGG